MFQSASKLVILAALLALGSSHASSQVSMSKGAHICDSIVPQEKPLMDAVKRRDLALTKQLLRQGVNPNARDDCGRAVITYAAQGGYTDILKELIAYRADVNSGDSDSPGRTPLMVVLDWSEEGKGADNYEIIKLLVDAGADVNLKGKRDEPPLTIAVRKELERVVELLIAAGADVNARCHIPEPGGRSGDGAGLTAYSYAAEMGNKKLKSMLLAAGADPRVGVADYKKEFGGSAIVHAAASGRTDVVEALLAEAVSVDASNEAGVTALMRVVNLSTLDALLAAGADVNRKDKDGYTPLIWAAVTGNGDLVKRLIAVGADLNAVTGDGETALDLAKPEVKDLLIQARAERGRSPLSLIPK